MESEKLDLFEYYGLGSNIIDCIKQWNKLYSVNKRKIEDKDKEVFIAMGYQLQELRVNYSKLIKQLEGNIHSD